METLVPDWTLDDDDSSAKDYFKRKKKEYTEDVMIEILKNQSDKSEIYWAILALRKIGTRRSIEYLKHVVCYKNMDIQGTSVLTIAKLADGTENSFLAELLLNKDFKQKWYAMVAIFYNANNDALPFVLEYGKAKIRNCKSMPEVGGLIITYLARYASDNEDAKVIFSRVNKDFENLYPYAKKCLRGEFPEIFK
ncbi:MAG: HEAT repeat domain-containing protein [Dysgonomonas sp.]|nr:HEAT repeat domain-containing protein [Dysgonomonas sp.]